MRYAIAAMLVVAELAWAQSFLTVIEDLYEAGPGTPTLRTLRCPTDFIPIYGVYPTRGANVGISVQVLDGAGNPATAPFSDLDRYRGGGHVVVVSNRGTSEFHGSAFLHCARRSAFSATQIIERTIQPGPTNFFPLTCPPPNVPVGYITDADGLVLVERARAYLVGSSPQNVLADGVYGPPSALGVGFDNTTAAPLALRGVTLCMAIADGQTHIVSSPVAAGESFAAFASRPDGFNVVADAFTVSGARGTDVSYWNDDGTVSSWSLSEFVRRVRRGIGPPGETRTVAGSKGLWLEGDGVVNFDAKQQVIGRAVIATLLVPSTTPVHPTTIVPIVEFHHVGLDHYFITASPKEIADLDGGVHAGWQRTGETFNAYGAGSSGRTGRRPVCRAYGNPAAGLDSHFYSASPQECVATLDNFGDDWLPEAAEVFQIELPDTTTGACAADRVPIYRLWNGRADSSHRFVRTLALRAQMIARGFVPEGYGPNGVVFCALP